MVLESPIRPKARSNKTGTVGGTAREPLRAKLQDHERWVWVLVGAAGRGTHRRRL